MSRKALKAVCLAAVMSLMLALPALGAGTPQWAENGIALRSIPSSSAYSPAIIPDGAGGAIVAWTDDRMASRNVYARRVDPAGVPLWEEAGVVLRSISTSQAWSCAITSDGAEGAIVTWEDEREGAPGIYAQWVDSEGAIQWTENGVALRSIPGSRASRPAITSDGAGGYIVTWRDERSGHWDIYAQRINLDGTSLWNENGVALRNVAASGTLSPAIIPDGAGGAIVTWADSRPDGPGIYAQRVNVSGTPQWAENGVPLRSIPGSNADLPAIIPDGTGGAIVTWADERSGYDIYAQRVNVSGTPQWAENGVPLRSIPGSNAWSCGITSDGAGGAIVTWRDERLGLQSNIFAQRVDPAGEPQWAENGVPLRSMEDSSAYSPAITSDGAGGAIVTWEDRRLGYYNIFAQRVDPAGVPQWTENGVALRSMADSSAEYPAITSDGDGGAIATWTDRRSGVWDVYAQKIITTHSITVTQSAHGTISPEGSEGVVVVDEGADQNFTIEADSGYRVASVTVDGVDLPEPVTSYTFENVREAHAITATFQKIWTITASAGEGGSIDPSGDVIVDEGDDQTFIIEADPGYRILDVVVDGESVGAQSEWEFESVSADHTITATFQKIWTISASAGSGGTINPSGAVVVDEGDDRSFTITAGAGYRVKDVKVDGASKGAITNWNFTGVSADHTIAAGFTAIVTNPTITSITPASGPPGTLVTIRGNNFGAGPASGPGRSVKASSPYVSFNGVKATAYPSWTNTQIKTVVPDGAGTGPVAVVTASGSSDKSKTFNVVSPTWYLAEGTTDWGFDTYIAIQNPNPQAVTVLITYMTADGPRSRAPVALPALSQTVINPRDDTGAADFSTRVECKEGKTIAVDRRMIWQGPEATSTEGHSSIGVTAPAQEWYLAEGSSSWGFETWLLVQNPNDAGASIEITYMIEGAAAVTKEKKVPASSRASFDMETDIGQQDASIMVTSDLPVIPERAMYRHNRGEGHDSIGTTTPAKTFYLAEGTTDWGFTTYVLVQNPNPAANRVNITYMTPEGPVPYPAFEMEPSSRKTVTVNHFLEGSDLSIKVEGALPLIAERAMYWDSGLGEACHSSIGMSQPHARFFLPDGETYSGHETYTLVQNPNPQAVAIEITYMGLGGEGNQVFTDTVAPNSRKTYNMADKVPAGRASIMVKSLTP